MNDQTISIAAPKSEGGFETWLMEFDRFLSDWMAHLPQTLKASLDYSPSSLIALEAHLLETFSSPDILLQQEHMFFHNAAAIYFGETARKTVGGKWSIRFDDPNYVYHGLPILLLADGGAPICPLTYLTTCVDRRKGTLLSDAVLRWKAKEG